MTLKIYSENTSERLNYILDELVIHQLKLKYKLYFDRTKFQSENGVKINYSNIPIDGALHIKPVSLLFEKGLQEIAFESTEWEGQMAIFKTGNQDIPFDIFAASFFLLSRYEEYVAKEFDQFGRFRAKNSIAYQSGFLQIPVINYWLKSLKIVLSRKFKEFKAPDPPFNFTPTIDIDNAYAFSHKSFLRTTGSLTKKLVNLQWKYLANQLMVLTGREKDPYDTFEYLQQVHEKANMKPIYFFLVGNYGKYDTNLPRGNKAMHKLIRESADIATIGLHPSFGSNTSFNQLKKEKEYLEDVLQKPIIHSRNHFLILRFPETYERLQELGIQHDYTMGFGEAIGFRAGISTPFYFYNLLKEESTNVMIHPFGFMDGTFKYYLDKNPEQALNEIKSMIKTIKEGEGDLISLWHNESLSNFRMWEGWQNLYSEMIQAAIN